jgi:hypothetical protein
MQRLTAILTILFVAALSLADTIVDGRNPDLSAYLKKDGSIPWTGDENGDGHNSTNWGTVGTDNLTSTGACSFATTGGNVGIGTANPNATLDVNGSIIASNDLTVAGNLIAHGSLTMGYLVSSNNTNEIVWFGDFQRPLTITNLGWFSTVGSATGIVFLADNATAPSAWDSICYTGLAFAAQVRSNDAVSISVTAGQRIGFMASECTNATLFVGW